jgi:hypothetical protein
VVFGIIEAVGVTKDKRWRALHFLIPLSDTRCLVPAFDGAFYSQERKEALWDRFYTGASQRQRRSVERYSIVKRA